MTFSTIFLIIMAVVVLVGLPIAVVWMFLDLIRGKKSDRPGGGGISSFVGAGLTEIDRLLARPSVEHQVEAENQVLKREDDQGGD